MSVVESMSAVLLVTVVVCTTWYELAFRAAWAQSRRPSPETARTAGSEACATDGGSPVGAAGRGGRSAPVR